MPEVGIVMTLKDRVSDEMNRIQNSGRALSKEFDELYERVNKNATRKGGVSLKKRKEVHNSKRRKPMQV